MIYQRKEIYLNDKNYPCKKNEAEQIVISAIAAEVHPEIIVNTKNDVRFSVTYTLDDGNTLRQSVPIRFFQYYLPYLINGRYDGAMVPASTSASTHLIYLVPSEVQMDNVTKETVGVTKSISTMSVGDAYSLNDGTIIVYIGDNYFASSRTWTPMGAWTTVGRVSGFNNIPAVGNLYSCIHRNSKVVRLASHDVKGVVPMNIVNQIRNAKGLGDYEAP